MSFQNWSQDKKIKSSDLVFTHAIKSELHKSLFEKAADQLTALRPTYSEGLQFLEILTDLILMGHEQSLFEKTENLEAYKKHLHNLRYPTTSARDEELKQKFEKLAWPYGSKIKFERRGDRAGVELKVFIANAADITKITSALERVQQELLK